MKSKIGIGSFLVLMLALGLVMAGCDAIGPSDTTTTSRAATTTTAAGTTTTTTTTSPTTTTSTTTTSTTTTTTTTTLGPASFTVSGIVSQNECDQLTVEVFGMVPDFSDRIPGMYQLLTFVNGTAEYSVATNEASTFAVIAILGDKPPLFIGGVGMTTGEMSVAQPQLVIFTCEAGVITSESAQDFNMYIFNGGE